jgi:hypothetical protein
VNPCCKPASLKEIAVCKPTNDSSIAARVPRSLPCAVRYPRHVITAKIRSEQCPEHLAVVRNLQVQKLVDNDLLAKLGGFA